MRDIDKWKSDENCSNNQEFERIYRQYVKPIYYYAYSFLHNSEEAEDITHDVFVTFFELKDKSNIGNIKSYLLVMTRNKSINRLKIRERESLVEDYSIFEGPSLKGGQINSELLSKLEIEIFLLPEEERHILLLHIKAGLKFREIANAINLSLPATYRRYKKALKTLKVKLKGVEHFE